MTDALVMALPVVVLDVLMQDQPERLLTDEPQPVQTFVLEGFDEPFAVGVGVGCRHRTEHGCDANREQDALEGGRILAVVVRDQERAMKDMHKLKAGSSVPIK